MPDIKFVFEGDPRQLASTLRDVAKETEKADEEVKQLGDDVDKTGEKGAKSGSQIADGMKLAAIGAAAAVAAITGVVMKLDELSARANIYAKQAKQFGTSAEEIQKVEGAFGLLTDGSVDAIRSVGGLQRAIAEARDGTETYADEFAKLGIVGKEALDKFASQSVSAQLMEIADRYSNLESEQDRFSVSATLLKDRYGALIPAFREGSGAIREAMDETERAGIISNELAAESEHLQDSLSLLTRAAGDLVNDVMAPAIPVLTEVAGELQSIVDEAKESGEIDDLATSFGEMAASLGEITTAIADLDEIAGPVFDLLTKNTRDMIEDLGWLAKQFKAVREELKNRDSQEALAELNERLGENTEEARAAEGAAADLERRTRKLADATALFGDDLNYEYRLLSGVARAEDEAAEAAGRLQGKNTAAAASTKELAEEVNGLAVEGLRELRREYDDLAATLDADSEKMAASVIGMDDAIAAANAEALQMTIDAVHQQAKEITAAAQQALKSAANAAVDVMGFMAGAASNISEIIVGQQEHLTAEQRKAAMAAFNVAKVAAASEAAISGVLLTIQAVQSVVSSVPGPAGIALGIATGVAMGTFAATQTAKIAAEQPSFHGGTTNAQEFQATLERGEGVVRKEAMAQPGARETVDAMNQGRGASNDRFVVYNVVDNKTTYAAEYEAIKTQNAPYYRLINKARRYRMGLRVPLAARA